MVCVSRGLGINFLLENIQNSAEESTNTLRQAYESTILDDILHLKAILRPVTVKS